MSSSWMYNGFPLKRADETTSGDDFPFVVQSLDAAIRHEFGLPVGVALTPAFSISQDGDVEVLVGLSIGSSVQIDEIVASIPAAAAPDEDEQLATVDAIRTFLGTYVDSYLSSTDLFVEKAGSTMTGELVADGGITGTTALNLSKVVFLTAPKLSGVALQGAGGQDLIQFDGSSALVGDASHTTHLTGSGARPLYKGEGIALVSDLVDAAGLVLAYVPQIGGTFTGIVEFANGLRTSPGVDYEMEYNAGASSFSALAVGTDALGDVVLDSGAGIHRFTGDVRVDEHIQFDLGSGFVDVLGYASSEVQLGHASAPLNLLGSGTRPEWNGAALALLGDVTGTYAAGAGITFSVLGGGATEISITTNGINATMMPVGNNGEYARLSPAGALIFDSLDIAAGTGMAVSEDAGTKQITVSIDNLGVDTAQLAADAVTAAKLANDAVVFANINATAPAGGFTAGSTYSLVATDSVLAWQRGGELLGTAERIEENWTNINGGSEGSPEETTGALSDGPYVVEYCAKTGDGASGAGSATYIKVVADGQEVFKGNIGALGYLSGAGDEVPFFRGAILAKETLEVTSWKGVTGDTGGVKLRIQRLN